MKNSIVYINSIILNTVISSTVAKAIPIATEKITDMIYDQFEYQNKFDFDERLSTSLRISHKYPNRVAIICELSQSCKKTMDLDKKKFLAPYDITLGQFLYILKKRIHMEADEAIFLFTENGITPSISMTVGEIKKYHKNKDGFLYFRIDKESTFGQNTIL